MRINTPRDGSNHYRDIEQLIEWVNGQTEPVVVEVATAGTEVAVSHRLGFVPALASQVILQASTGQGVVYPGTTPWTTRLAYLTATVAGTYAVIFRR